MRYFNVCCWTYQGKISLFFRPPPPSSPHKRTDWSCNRQTNHTGTSFFCVYASLSKIGDTQKKHTAVFLCIVLTIIVAGLCSVGLLCCFHGKMSQRRLDLVTKSPVSTDLQASFNLRRMLFSDNPHDSHVLWGVKEFLTSDKKLPWSSLSTCVGYFGCFHLIYIFFFSYSLWGEERDELWGMSQKCVGMSFKGTKWPFQGSFDTWCMYVCVLDGIRNVPGGGSIATGSSSTSTPVRLVWGLTDLRSILTPPPPLSALRVCCVFVCVMPCDSFFLCPSNKEAKFVLRFVFCYSACGASQPKRV